jgi:hypothetical protein
VPHGAFPLLAAFDARAVLDAFLEAPPASTHAPTPKDAPAAVDRSVHDDDGGAATRETILAIKRTFQPSTVVIYIGGCFVYKGRRAPVQTGSLP